MWQIPEKYRINSVLKQKLGSIDYAMAKQKGIIPLKGSIDGFTFYKAYGKYIVRKTAGPSKKQIMSGANFKVFSGRLLGPVDRPHFAYVFIELPLSQNI